MIEAAMAAGLVSANSQSGGAEFVAALKRDLAFHFDASPSVKKRAAPVWWREGKRNAEEFVWVAGIEPPDDEGDIPF